MKTFTEGLKAAFIENLRATCNVTLAAQAAGVSSATVYKHKQSDVLFAERWDEAIQEGIDLLEHKAHQRAFDGVSEPVFYQGFECGSVRKYSDALTMFLLKSHRPDKYRERSQVDSNVSGDFKLIVETGVPTAPVTPTPTDDLV
jgi:hypothetical protein